MPIVACRPVTSCAILTGLLIFESLVRCCLPRTSPLIFSRLMLFIVLTPEGIGSPVKQVRWSSTRLPV